MSDRRKIGVALGVILCGMAVSGCQGRPAPTSDMLTKYPTPIYSLTGERLNGGALGQPACDEAQAAWLKRVDQDRDGTLDAEELMTEAKRQFALMDLNHDGIITAAELSAYRSQMDGTSAAMPQEPTDRRGVQQLPMHPASSQPDPVLSADSNLDFQVTLDEYLTQQRENLSLYDKDKDRSLDAQELNKLCRIREQAATPSRR